MIRCTDPCRTTTWCLQVAGLWVLLGIALSIGVIHVLYSIWLHHFKPRQKAAHTGFGQQQQQQQGGGLSPRFEAGKVDTLGPSNGSSNGTPGKASTSGFVHVRLSCSTTNSPGGQSDNSAFHP